MMREALSRYPFGNISGFGMLIFLAIFVGAVIWVYRRRSGEIYRDLAALPLVDLQPVTSSAKGTEK